MVNSNRMAVLYYIYRVLKITIFACCILIVDH